MTENGPPLNVAYLGPEASFSHQAAIEVFEPHQSSSTSSSSKPTTTFRSGAGRPVTLHPLPSFSAIFSAIQDSDSASASEQVQDQISYDYAVVPIENSTNGSVVQVLDLLAQCGLDSKPASDSAAAVLYPDLEVCAEYYLPVHHCLFVAHPAGQTTAIRTLYTHPQVWGQCGRFLTTHFPPNVVERIDVGSTSAAAQLVAREAKSTSTSNASSHGEEAGGGGGVSAAISSKLAGQKHSLTCLAENIEDEPGSNTTRFFVLRNRRRRQQQQQHQRLVLLDPGREELLQDKHVQRSPKAGYYKSLITFTIHHTRPGSLADALAVFKQFSFNLTSIDTRPSRKRNWQYVFFVECEEETLDTTEGEQDGPEVRNLRSMLEALQSFTESLRYLGRFEDCLRSGVAHVQP